MRRLVRATLRWSLLTAVGAALCWATPAYAQQQTRVSEEKAPIKQWACAVLCTAFILAVALKNPKRTHLG